MKEFFCPSCGYLHSMSEDRVKIRMKCKQCSQILFTPEKGPGPQSLKIADGTLVSRAIIFYLCVWNSQDRYQTIMGRFGTTIILELNKEEFKELLQTAHSADIRSI